MNVQVSLDSATNGFYRTFKRIFFCRFCMTFLGLYQPSRLLTYYYYYYYELQLGFYSVAVFNIQVQKTQTLYKKKKEKNNKTNIEYNNKEQKR
jgi:hypothetical protein